jgi:hypothetical protein
LIDRIVAVLEQRCLFHFDLRAGQAAAFDSAAHDPIDTAVPMVSAAIAVLAEGATKFADHHHDCVVPSRPAGVREAS